MSSSSPLTEDHSGQQAVPSGSAEGQGVKPTQEHKRQQAAAGESAEEHVAPAEEPAQQQAVASGPAEEDVVAEGQPNGSEWQKALVILTLASVLLVAAVGTIFAYRSLSGGDETTTSTPGERILMCITTETEQVGALPPDGLCNVVVYDSGPENFATPTPPKLQAFIDFAKKSTSSHCGLNVEEERRNQSLWKLKTQEGENIVRSLWSNNIRSYGALGPIISMDTTPEYISEVVDLLSTLKRYQDNIKGGSYTQPLYIFVGVAPLYKKGTDTKGTIKARFDELMSKATPNIVLFRTSDCREFNKGDRGCVSNAISVWKDPPLSDQPSFEGSLSFRKTVKLPRGTSEMLSMSLCNRFAIVDPSSQFQLGEGNNCSTVSTEPIHDNYCDAGKYHKYYDPVSKLDTDRWVYLGRTKSHNQIAAFEKKDSIHKKMCNAAVEYQYAGGWAMYGMHCNDNDNVCKDANFTTGFARLHWMKYYMTQTFTSC